ncbi:MAG: hypothetical protein COB78_01565 [Hyphomicrobiales bacterium]|nr:MAG: hypothetical protein COB78_01565 [Hyphomicrobiales bacterium]
MIDTTHISANTKTTITVKDHPPGALDASNEKTAHNKPLWNRVDHRQTVKTPPCAKLSRNDLNRENQHPAPLP